MIYEQLSTPVCEKCDVLVCGGGFAGISAALAAARMGRKVILLEKQYMLGGLGTAGLITIYLPLCDGLGHQVSFGIAEELFHLSISMGWEDRYPANWLESNDLACRTEKDPRLEVQYNAQLFAILAEQQLLKTGVKILYGTAAAQVAIDGDKITHVVIESKSGRQAIGCTAVVDATGDCDIAHMAKVPTAVFEQGNILAAWYYSVGDGQKTYKLNKVGAADVPEGVKTDRDTAAPLVRRRFLGLSGEELSEMMQLSHNASLEHLIRRRQKDPTLMPVTMATIPQIRMTRRIVGEYTQLDTEMHTYFPDSIGMVSDWRRRGPVYEVPFRTLYNASVKNLICAGRCTSVNDGLWDVMRVIPCCAVTGQAAGTAAAITDDFAALDVAQLQKLLQENGVVLHEDELK